MPDHSSISIRVLKTVLSLGFLLLVYFFNYQLVRTDFVSLISIFAGLFIIYVLLLQPKWDGHQNHFKWIVMLAIAARVLILFSEPNLSDDFYRFIWDGKLWLHGFNPFDGTPKELMLSTLTFNNLEWIMLADHINSPDYHSIYPPVNQLVFYLANVLSPNSISGAIGIMKLIFLLAELTTIILIYQLCLALSISTKHTLWYALNPLVIIEFCGNLHFEALMIPFLLLSILLLIQQKTNLSALAFAGAVLTKLHPLLLLPFFLKYLGWKKGIQFGVVTLATTILFFGVMLWPADLALIRLENLSTSFRLYFESFEFNASIYYIFRWIGFESYGYNPIDKVGKLMVVFNLIVLTWLFFKMKPTIKGLIGISFLAYLSYTLFATTVHPWYVLPLLPFALMSNYKSIVTWSGLITLSYFAYSQPDWHENFYLLGIEYTCIFAFLIYEFRDRTKLNGILH